MKELALKIAVLLALLAPAAVPVQAAPPVRVKAIPRNVLSPRDSLWIKLVTDSALVILPGKDTVLVVNVAPEAVVISSDVLMMREDSILRARKLADSLRVAREDSIARVNEMIDKLIQEGQDYNEAYYFGKAYESFLAAEALCSDPELKKEITALKSQSDFSRHNTRKIPELTVVARATLSVDDFFLYYPLKDKSWRPVDGAPAVYYPGDGTEIHLNRDRALDMIYPMYEGDRMYFASKNLPGFGGYDLYYSDWNEDLGEWGEPHNLGFPYNSPFDDFLFMTTADGKYNIFSSDRGLVSGGDEVHVYVVLNSQEVKYRSVGKPRELGVIAELTPVKNVPNGPVDPNDLQSRYQKAVDEEQELQRKLEAASPEERPTLQEKLLAVQAEKAVLEEQIINIQNPTPEPSFEQVLPWLEGKFNFVKKSFGPKIKIIFDE